MGMFDGVHRGHQRVLKSTCEAARQRGVQSVALTFDPHPAAVHRPESKLAMISSLPDRLEKLAATGIDTAVVINYTLEFARQSPEEFVRNYFVEALGAVAVVVGSDVRFGWQNAGDSVTLGQLGKKYGFDLTLVDDAGVPGQDRRWSSTWVRELIAAGDMGGAADILGRPHRVRGTVVHGYKRGRQLGFPTANLEAEDLGVVPQDGVYAGWLRRPQRESGQRVRLPAAISVGTNPVFDGVARTVEAHVLGRTDLDLYGEEVIVEFTHYLRPMVKFDGVDALVEQLRQDVIVSAKRLGVPVPEPLDPDDWQGPGTL